MELDAVKSWLSANGPSNRLLLTIASLVVLTTAFSYLCTWYRLRHVPGPFLNSLTTLVQLKKVYGGSYHKYLEDLHQRYGRLVRVGPNEVMFSDPETFVRINGVRSRYTRGPFFEALRAQPNKDHVFSTRDEQKHKDLRAKMGPGYAGQENGGFERSVDKIVQQLVDLIEQKYISTPANFKPVDFSDKATYFTLDVISEIAFGGAFGFLKNDKDMFGYLAQNAQTMPFMILLGTAPSLAKFKDMWPFSLLMPSEKDKFGLGYMVGFATKFIDARLAQTAAGKPGHDIIQSFMNHGLPRDQLIQEITLQVLAGSDTSATSIRMTLLYLISNPPSLRRLLSEINSALTAESSTLASSTLNGGVITATELQSLPYLQSVIREGLRIYPPATGLVSKLVPSPDGDMIHGYHLPGETAVGQNIWGICRSKEVWGEDADIFRPERWLEVDDTKMRELARVQEMVFGYGKWQCLGKGLVAMELGKVFFELFRRYDFSIVDPVHPVSLRNVAAWVTKDFWLRITRRDRIIV